MGQPENLVIREGRVTDAEAMGTVHVRAWQSAYRGVMPDDYLDGLSADERSEMWRGRLSRADLPRLLVAESGGEVVGFAVLGTERPSPDRRGAGELYAINLDPDHWGNGIGRALLRAATAALVALGFEEAILWVAPENDRARVLYTSEGWVQDGASAREEVLGVTVTEIRYRRPLRSADL